MPNNKACLITVVLLALTLAGLIYLRQARAIPAAEVRLEDIPLELGEWQGKDISISERTYEILETKDVLIREYTSARGEKVVLVIVYSGVNRGSFHPPEICYLGGGRELLDKGFEEIELAEPGKSSSAMQVNRLLMEDKAGREIAWYWFTGGRRVTANYYRQQCYFIWDEFRRRHAGGTLIRVSTRVTGSGLEGAEALGKDFIGRIAPILLDYLIPENYKKKLTFSQ